MARSRSRDEDIRRLLPKLFGLAWERGGNTPPGPEALINPSVEVHVDPINQDAFAVSVYAPMSSPAGIQKVFSAHLTSDRARTDPVFFRYQQGRCGVLSWKRGDWEQRILNSAVKTRTVEELAANWAKFGRGVHVLGFA